ncbi:zonadhesin-like isoform X2 [Ptychodera flava]|uniref:zonadhesin-like isoform X2 n=1 Tax=Ptychodera flava TaxID=63121 RepID=UPI003969C87D
MLSEKLLLSTLPNTSTDLLQQVHGDTSPTEYSPNKCVKHSCDTTSVSPMCPSPHTKLSSSAMPCTYEAYATPVSKVEINSQFQSQSGPRPTAQKQESFLDLLNDSDSDVTMHDLDTNTTTGGVIAAAMQPLYHDDDESEVYTQQPAEIPKQVYTQLPAEIPKQVYTQLPAEIPKQVYTQPAKISKQVYTQQPAEISKQVYTQQPAEISKQDYVMIPKPPPEVCNYLKEVFQILTEAKPTTAEHIKVEPYEKGVVGGQPHLSKSPTAGVTSTSPVLGCDPNMQTTGSLEEFTELVPKSGVMIPIPTISTILAEARQELKKLFLKLVDHFFPAEVRAVSTATSRSTNGKMPLDQNIVQAIKSNNMQKMTSRLL